MSCSDAYYSKIQDQNLEMSIDPDPRTRFEWLLTIDYICILYIRTLIITIFLFLNFAETFFSKIGSLKISPLAKPIHLYLPVSFERGFLLLSFWGPLEQC